MKSIYMKEFNGHQIACAFNDAGSKEIVIFCHGFRGSNTGPRRFFVRTANELAKRGLSSLLFGQYGCGNSDGDFMESRFDDWVATTKAVTKHYLDQGYRVSLLGQSMGGATVIVAAADMPEISSVVAWAPGVITKPYEKSGEYMEEMGERVDHAFWEQAYEAKIADQLTRVKAPTLIFQCSDDKYISAEDHAAIETNAQENHKVIMLKDHTHSGWTYDQATETINKTVDYLHKKKH